MRHRHARRLCGRRERSAFCGRRLYRPKDNRYGLLIVLAFEAVSHRLAGPAFIIAQMAIIFSLNTCLMYTGRIPRFSFIPGMFFGFASFFATFFGGFGPIPHNPYAAW